MGRYSIYVWKMCENAVRELGGDKKWVPLEEIVRKVHDMYPESVNESTIRCQVFRHCVNCHPTHDEFPDEGRMWRERHLFITDGKGNYRFYRIERDYDIYRQALEEDNILP